MGEEMNSEKAIISGNRKDDKGMGKLKTEIIITLLCTIVVYGLIGIMHLVAR
jgi:hypothetical protein